MKVTLYLSLILFCSTSFAQFYSIDKNTLAEIENKGVIFELSPENENDLSVLPKKEQLEYPEFNKTLNDAAKRTLPRYWKLTKGEVVFKTQKEIAALSITDLKSNVLVSCEWIKKDTQFQGMLYLYSFHVKHVNNESEYQDIFEFSYLPNSQINDADFVFFLKTLTSTKAISLQYDEYKKSNVFSENMQRVETKTLLVDSAILKKDVTIEGIKIKYPYKFEIVNFDVIDKAINEECDTCLFFKLIWSRKSGMAMFDVFDTKDMKILAALGTGGVTVKIGGKGRMYKEMGHEYNMSKGMFEYKMVDKFTPPGEAGKGGKTLWKSSMKIMEKHFPLIYSEKAQKVNFK